MPNILKYFSSPEAESYPFLDTEEFAVEPDVVLDPENDGTTLQETLTVEVKEPKGPIGFAQLQADTILREAKREAEELLEMARAEAEAEAQRIYDQARQDGFDQGKAEGVARGMEQAMEECTRIQREKAVKLEQDVQSFLDKASGRLDRLLDSYVEELRDLSIAIAEKVVCVSLKSSDAVIGRMIQNAIDKRKRREWVHIYIAECDVKRLTPLPAQLASALDALSDRVRIIPIAEDEPGTCIIEMPDEIIDASASTQIKNISTVLYKMPLPGVGNTED